MTRQRSQPATRAYHTATLADLQGIIWSLLVEGVSDASSPFHTPALATVGEGEPDVRTVVLRHADAASRQIDCHTDWRSPKRSYVEAHNRASWMIYDRARKLQLRLAGKVTLHHKDALARERWCKSPPQRRAGYASPLAPGAIVQQPTEASADPEGGWDTRCAGVHRGLYGLAFSPGRRTSARNVAMAERCLAGRLGNSVGK